MPRASLAPSRGVERLARGVALALLIASGSACSQRPLRWLGGDGHDALACRDCHQGPVEVAGRAAVPDRTCAAAGCHAAQPGDTVSFGAVALSHTAHGDGDPDLECAACHTHAEGESVLTSGLGPCTVCHLEEMTGAESGDCRTCHGVPERSGETSQGVTVEHRALPWVEEECTRCHYDVSPQENGIDERRCAACHESLPEAAEDSDPHPDHAGFTCTACHEADTHRVRRMSSAVDVVCADCHARPHEVGDGWTGPQATCDGCHREAHADQQRLVLGLVDPDVEPVPSEKFLMGMTCRSCHAPEGDPDAVARTTGSDCTACHSAEYASVLAWWRDGVTQRVEGARRFVDGVARLREGDTLPDLARAGEILDFVDGARGVHNLTMTHRLLQRAVGLAAGVAATLGPAAPPAPNLGLAPDANACSRCHYNLLFDASRPGREMNDRFHREVAIP